MDTKNGTLWAETDKIPYHDARGIIVGIIGFSIDITDRKQAQATLDRERALLNTLMDNIPDYIYFKDLQSRFIRTNKAHAQAFALSDPAEAIGKTDFDFFTEEHALSAFEDEQRIIRTGQPIVGLVEKETWRDRGDTWVSTTKVPLRDDKGNIVGTSGISRDITELRRADETRRLDSQIMASMVDGVYLIRASDGMIVYANPQFERMFGYGAGELVGKHVSIVNAGTDKSPQETPKEIIQGLEKRGVWTGEVHNMKKDGTPFWCEASVSTFTHSEYGRVWVSVHQDITERKRAEEQLLHNAFYDALTGLPNRALFLDRLGHALERAKRAHLSGFAVLFLDVDRFKLVNDSLGHALGDQLLIATAHRLEMCLRSADTVARLGGDEFVILLEDITSLDEVKRVTERIGRELALPFDLEGHRVFSSASIGIVPSAIGYAHPEEVLRDADIAMYRAKMAGRARSEVFDRTMRDDAMARLDWETDLRSAVERHEFRVYYQPIVVLERSKIIGFEALVRWEHPTRGLITPENFISLAEETGLIIPIGEWVLREACRQLREWQTAFPLVPPLTISVNLSAKQFTHPELGGQIEQILADTGLDPGSLRLEITESVIMDDCESARNMFQQLKALGVQVQIDDFGTGYSSLSYLQQFPVATLKIDRSFISRMPVNGKGSDIVRMIVRLAHEMGLEVTAEGVETRQQLAQLRKFGCEFGQGYLFSGR